MTIRLSLALSSLVVGIAAGACDSGGADAQEGVIPADGAASGPSDAAGDTAAPPAVGSDWQEPVDPSPDVTPLKNTYTESLWFEFIQGLLDLRFPAGAALAAMDGAKEAAAPYVQGQTDRFDKLAARAHLAMEGMVAHAALSSEAHGNGTYVYLPRPGAPIVVASGGITTPPRSSVASRVPASVSTSVYYDALMLGAPGTTNFFGMLAHLDQATYGLLTSVVATDLMSDITLQLEREQVLAALIFLGYYIDNLREALPAIGAQVRAVENIDVALRDLIARALFASALAADDPKLEIAIQAMDEVVAQLDLPALVEAFLAGE